LTIRVVLSAWTPSFALDKLFGVCVLLEHDAAGPCFVIGAKLHARKRHAAANFKSRIAISSVNELTIGSVLSLPESFAANPRTLIGTSVSLLALAAVFGVLNLSKTKTLCASATTAAAERQNVDQYLIKKENELKACEAAIATAQAKLAEREGNSVVAEEQLAQILNEKKQVETKLQDKDAEIAALQKQADEKQPGAANPGAASTVELQAQLDDARQQLDNAEREKSVLSEKIQTVTEKSSRLEDEKKRRAVARGKVGVRGTILAVNRAYNFVVLNLGGRNGVEPHSEMLIVRDGTYIGKIRISSVEPATAIGDIITNTLARGVQVQPGDIVIYAGSNS
jgi:hypothetical protein